MGNIKNRDTMFYEGDIFSLIYVHAYDKQFPYNMIFKNKLRQSICFSFGIINHKTME